MELNSLIYPAPDPSITLADVKRDQP